MDWCVYLILTEKDTLYCGATNDVHRRYAQHSAGRGAKYLRANKPVALKWVSDSMSKVAALKLESRIKAMSAPKKRQLIAGEIDWKGLK